MSKSGKKIFINENIEIFKLARDAGKKIKYHPINYSKFNFTKKIYEQPKIEEYHIDFAWIINYYTYIVRFLQQLNVIKNINIFGLFY